MADTVTQQEYSSMVLALRARGFSWLQARSWMNAMAQSLGYADVMQIEVDEMPAIMDAIAEANPP
jgi:hypothetical protein